MNLGMRLRRRSRGRVYFGKPVQDLSSRRLRRSRHPAAAERQSPYVNHKWATQRRNYTLRRMAEEGFITEAQAEAARTRPIVLAGLPGPSNTTAPYFTEEVRQHLERQYGAQELYEAGLSVQTTLDYDLQTAATKAVDRGLRALDKRRGFRKPSKNVAADGKAPAEHTERRWARPIRPGDIVPAVVMDVSSGAAVPAHPPRRRPARPCRQAQRACASGGSRASSRKPGSSGRAGPRRRTSSRPAISSRWR